MITRLLAAAAMSLALGVAGCNHRKPGTCSVSCADDSSCPDGTACGSDGYCHAAGDGAVCSTVPEQPDATPPADGGARRDDAAPGRPDAEPAPDAGPCAGVPNRVADSDPRNYPIPDGDPFFGIDLTLSFDTDCVTVETVQVWVEIIHPYRGDVEIVLTSPGGDSRLLLDDSDDSTANIFAEFNVAAFAGESAGGDWVLTVRDVLSEFTGRVDYWSIGINRPAP
jgi:hypothetical protein